MNLLLSANQLGSLTRTERNDYMQEVSDEIADRIKEERALIDMEDDFIGYDFSKVMLTWASSVTTAAFLISMTTTTTALSRKSERHLNHVDS